LGFRQNGPTANNLNAGTHSVTVEDSNGCQTVNTVTISEPTALSASVSITHETLPSAKDGSIDLIITGGIAPYTYNWDNGAMTEDLTTIAPGDYCVTITDTNGCLEFNCATVNPGTSSLYESIDALTTFELFPNPAHTTATLEIIFSTPTDIQLKVVNLLGKEVYATEANNFQNNQFEFDLTHIEQMRLKNRNKC